MIVIFIDDIEDFVQFLDKRIMNEIFFEFRKKSKTGDLSNEVEFEIFLHFLSKVEESMVLYETKINITDLSTSLNEEEVKTKIQEILSKVNPSLKLIKGKIREIFLSYSF